MLSWKSDVVVQNYSRLLAFTHALVNTADVSVLWILNSEERSLNYLYEAIYLANDYACLSHNRVQDLRKFWVNLTCSIQFLYTYGALMSNLWCNNLLGEYIQLFYVVSVIIKM